MRGFYLYFGSGICVNLRGEVRGVYLYFECGICVNLKGEMRGFTYILGLGYVSPNLLSLDPISDPKEQFLYSPFSDQTKYGGQ